MNQFNAWDTYRAMYDVFEKWRSDIKYLMSNHDTEVERVKIDRIFLVDKQWQ